MRTVDLADVGITLMAEIHVYGMMQKLQIYFPEQRDKLVDIMGIYLNCIMHQLSDGQRRKTCADSDWSDMTIQGAFII